MAVGTQRDVRSQPKTLRMTKEIFIMKKIFLIIYGTALFMLTMAFLLTSNYKDYRFYITLIILLAIGKIVEGRINK